MANKEIRVSKTNTFEEFRQKTNELALHVGDNELLDSSIADRTFNYDNVSAGTTILSDLDDNSKSQVFDIKTEETLDNTGGYIILTGSPNLTGFVADATLTQAGGYYATIVSVSSEKILVKNSNGSFNSTVALDVGANTIPASNVQRIIGEAYPKGVVRVYLNGTEIEQDLNSGGFHVVNYSGYIGLLNSPTVTDFTEGTTIYQGSSLSNATFSGTVLQADSTVIKLKNFTGTFSATTQIRIDGSSSTINGVDHDAITVVDNTFGNAIELNTPASSGDDIKIHAPSIVDAVNELQDDVGITENLTTGASNLVDAVNEIEAVFDASTHEISAGTNVFNVTSGQFTIDSSSNIILDPDGGTVRLNDAGVTYAELTSNSGNVVIKSGTTTMLSGSGADGTFAQDITVSQDATINRDVSVVRNLDVDGNTTLDDTTIDGVLDVGTLNSLFTNTNNVKLALNELHTEMGSAAIVGVGTPASGLSNLTAGLNAIDAEIGATAYLAGSGTNATITFAVDAIQDYIGSYSAGGVPVANTVSSTITGALNQLHTEIGSSSLIDNLPSDFTYNVTDHTTATNTMSSFIGNTSIADIGTTDTVTGALQKLHAEIGDSNLSVFTATDVSGALRELESEKVYLNSSSLQTITSQLDFRGDISFTDNGNNADRMTFGTGTTLDLSDASLILPGSGGANFDYPFLFVDGDVALMGFGVDRAHVSMANKTTTKIQWNETLAGTKPSHGWQLVGLNDQSGDNTADIVTFYNAQDLIKSNTESGIVVGWDDQNQNFDFNADDFTITLAGDLSGSVAINDLASATLTATIVANSVALGTDTSGNYVASVSGTTNEIEVSGNTGDDGRSITVGLPNSVTISHDLTVNGNVSLGNATTDQVTIAGNLIVNGDTTTLNTATLEVEDSVIITNSLNQNVGEFGIAVKDSNGNIAHTLYYDYGQGRWEADGSLIVSEATIGAPTIDSKTFGIGTNYDIDNDGSTTGISVSTTQSGNTISTAFGNTDKGSSQYIFKNVASDSGTAVADGNDDTLTISGGTSIDTAVSGDTLTVTHGATGPSNQTAVSSNNSGNTFIQDISFDAQGHVSGVGTGTVSINNGTITIEGGTDIATPETNTFTLNGSETTITINHAEITGADDVSSTANTFIDSITVENGHITAVGTGSVDLSSKDNYDYWAFDTSSNTSNETVTSGDVVRFSAGTGMTVNHSGDTITFTCNVSPNQNTDTNYYLDGITKDGNTLTFSVAGTTDQTYTFGSNAFNSTTIPAAANNGTLTLNTSGSGLSGSTTFGANQSSAGTFTVSSNATTAATPNTIAYRDGSGHINANHFNATSSVSTSIQYLTGQQSNNYYYKYSAASVRSFLSVPTINDTTYRYNGGHGGWRRLDAFTHNYGLGFYNTGTYTRDFTVKLGTGNESYSPDSFIVTTRLADYYFNLNAGGQDQMRYTISEKRYNMIRTGYSGTNSQSAGKYLSWRSQITKVGASNSWPRSLAIEVWATGNGMATAIGADAGTFQGNFLM